MVILLKFIFLKEIEVGKPEGEITKILERKKTDFVGVITNSGALCFCRMSGHENVYRYFYIKRKYKQC